MTIAISTNAAAATPVVPRGGEQINYYASVNDILVVPEKTIETRDLSSPISFTHPGLPYVSAMASAIGTPTVSVSAISRDDVFSGAFARAALSYYIFIDSPESIDVPIFFSYKLSVRAAGSSAYSGNEGSSAYAAFVLQEYSANPETVSNSYLGELISKRLDVGNRYGSAEQIAYLERTDRVLVSSGHYLAPLLAATASVQDGGTASAFADPYFYIDPVFAAEHPGISLTFSPFVGNDAPPVEGVPEPSTWMTMILGFGLVGASFRKRRGSSTLRTT